MFRLFHVLLLAGILSICGVAQGQTLAAIRTAGHLNCGTVAATDDWNSQDVHGNLSALGAEICRAVAVAILGRDDAVTIPVFPAEPEALDALKSGSIQLAVGISPSATTAIQYGVGFGMPVFYDSQRIMVAKQSGITDLAGLRDKLICALDMSPPNGHCATNSLRAASNTP